MARFLADTNVISEPTRKKPNIVVAQLLNVHRAEISISSTVLHELLHGCERLPESNKRRSILHYIEEAIINSLAILPYDIEAARWHASERARLTSKGKTPSFADGQIAAVSVVNGLTLLTRNTSDFENFQGLDVINWYE